jgi:hypothetical protein
MTARSFFALLTVLVFLLCAHRAVAQIPPTYVQFDPFTVKGALYRPDPSRERDVAILLIHRVNNYVIRWIASRY